MTAARRILELLSTGERLRGLELVKRSNNELWRSTVYVRLNQLEEAGFVRSFYEGEPDPEWPKPRFYEITSRGRAALVRDDL